MLMKTLTYITGIVNSGINKKFHTLCNMTTWVLICYVVKSTSTRAKKFQLIINVQRQTDLEDKQ